MDDDASPVARHLQVPKRRFPQRKRIRLNGETYRMGYGYSITINTSYRARLFVDATAVRTALACLQDAAAKYSARVFAYCFMPDHIHLLAQTPPGVDFTEFIRSFKQPSGFALKMQLDRSPIWQPRYYDHALRSDEDLLVAARYIWGNPVRAGIVTLTEDYPYSGSLEWPASAVSGP